MLSQARKRTIDLYAAAANRGLVLKPLFASKAKICDRDRHNYVQYSVPKFCPKCKMFRS